MYGIHTIHKCTKKYEYKSIKSFKTNSSFVESIQDYIKDCS